KVDPQRDGVDVHEQEVAAELPFQPIVHSAGVTSAVVAAIADEDLICHHQTPGGPLPKYILSNGAHLARLSLGPISAASRSVPRMTAASDDNCRPFFRWGTRPGRGRGL